MRDGTLPSSVLRDACLCQNLIQVSIVQCLLFAALRLRGRATGRPAEAKRPSANAGIGKCCSSRAESNDVHEIS